MKILRLLLVLAFFLAGCATSKPADTLILEPTATESKPIVAAATSTTQPSTATSMPTPLPVTSTPGVRQQERAAILPLVTPCNFVDQPISYSPNQDWVVVSCAEDKPEDGITTKFIRMDGSKQWRLSFFETFLKPYRTGDTNLLSAALQKTFIPVRWTKNEDFVYLAVQTSDQDIAYKGYDGLFRLDLSTGKSRPVLKPATAPLSATYDFKFSPSGTKLAYIKQAVQPISIVIVDTGSGQENKITLDGKFSQAGSLLWSKDEQKLIVSALDANKNGGNSVILYDLETMENEYITQNSANTYLPLEWVDTNTIYAENYPGKWVYMDLSTLTTNPAPAPTPEP